MAFKFKHPSGVGYFQVVLADTRGDKCYANRKGFYWHKLDPDSAIIEDTVTGPFDSYDAAYASANTHDPLTPFQVKSQELGAARAAGLASVSYTISINEAQRKALLEVIHAMDADRADAPLEYWVNMLSELPRNEAEHPGITHGFCL